MGITCREVGIIGRVFRNLFAVSDQSQPRLAVRGPVISTSSKPSRRTRLAYCTAIRPCLHEVQRGKLTFLLSQHVAG